MIILGYEEQGAPSYYTDFTQPKIDDEAMVKGKTGWSLKLHNRFGFMTGFLLKDVNPLFITGISAKNPVTLHVDPEGFFFPLPFSLESVFERLHLMPLVRQ